MIKKQYQHKRISFLLLFIPILLFSQSKIEAILESRMTKIVAEKYIGTDAYDCQYFIHDNTLFKTKANETWQYKNITLGNITRVDIQNPLRVIVFYENFNTAIALDNQLNELQKNDFSNTKDDIIATAVGVSINNNLWLYNNLTMQLGLYNYDKNWLQYIGQPFNQNIKNYYTTLNYFYWIDTNNQFYSCDIFGKVTSISSIPIYDSIFIVNENVVLYKNKESLYLLDFKNYKTILIDNIEKSYQSFFYKDQKLSIFTPEGIVNYKINLP